MVLSWAGWTWAISIRRLYKDFSYLVPHDGWLGADWENHVGIRDRRYGSYERPLSRPSPPGDP
jgi:hypothetical protein